MRQSVLKVSSASQVVQSGMQSVCVATNTSNSEITELKFCLPQIVSKHRLE